MTTEWQSTLQDEAATEEFGRKLANALLAGTVVHLQGDLGMGKTTLSRGLIQQLGHQGAVKSPTYALVEPYEHLQPMIYHFDLYRLRDPEELEFMGIRDYFNAQSVVLIEWPERGEGLLPAADIVIRLSANEQGGRLMQIVGLTATGNSIVEQLRAVS